MSQEIPHLVEDLLVALPCIVEHREGLERLLERYPLPNVRTLTLKHSRCFGIKDSVPSALLPYPLTSLTLNIELYESEHLYELLMCYPTLKHLDTSLAYVLDRNHQMGTGLEEAEVNDLSASISILPLCSSIQLSAAHVLRNIRLVGFLVPDLHRCQQLLEMPVELCDDSIFASLSMTLPSGPKLEMLHLPFLTLEACKDDNNAIIGVKWFADCLKSGQGPVNVSRIKILR
ncbi:hypothetical protein EDD85DRAFT_597907 [Armillaria nabsnona]|nr:hypothetical protein EDD85DRAFT_597907 [Armillaria nabsnona]